jgi:hypothetical protein
VLAHPDRERLECSHAPNQYPRGALPMEEMTLAARGSIVFLYARDLSKNPGFTRSSGSSGYSSLRDGVTCFVLLLFKQLTSVVNG